jgi:hypothetical protein
LEEIGFIGEEHLKKKKELVSEIGESVSANCNHQGQRTDKQERTNHKPVGTLFKTMAIQEEKFTPSFTTVPILPLSQARDPKTKPAFLKDLRDTLLNVGFLYISETGLPEDLVKRVCELTKEFFDENVLPLDVKERIEMKNEKSFLGWSRVGFPFRPCHSECSPATIPRV